MSKSITAIAESLLGRKLREKDGIKLKKIEEAEDNIGIKFPEALKEFWLVAGNTDMFTMSFNEFCEIDELELVGDYLPFISENQGVCVWAFNIKDADPNPQIYQSTDYDSDKPEWHAENIKLNEFISLMMYFQCAEGGYEYGGETDTDIDDVLSEADSKWEKVVDHNGLVIYQNNQTLIWYITENNGKIDTVMCSTLTEDDFDKLADKYDFSGF